MERLNQHKLTLGLDEKSQGSKHIYLIVIVLMLFGQASAQENTDRVTELINQLKSPSLADRQIAGAALGRIGPAAEQAIPVLIAALKDESAYVRSKVADALGSIGPEAKQAIPALIEALKDENTGVRSSAVGALGRIGPEAKQAIPALIMIIRDEKNTVRTEVAGALGKIGPEAVPALIETLKDENAGVRSSAAEALGEIGPEARQAIPALIEALGAKQDIVRSSAASALGRMGLEGKQAIPTLIKALKDKSKYVRKSAATALSSIAKALFDTRSTELLPQLKTAYEVLQADSGLKDQAADVKRTVDYFESLRWVKLTERIKQLVRNYPYISLTLAAYFVLQLVWLSFFWLRPLLLLKAITSLGQVGERFRIPWLNITMPIRPLLVFPLFYYRSRLLDAWVRSNLLTARENFASKHTVAQRKVYVAMPASINDKTCDSLSAATFQPILNKSKLTVLVAGEGGAGKTSLACQMALWAMEDDPHEQLCKAHRMLPVLIESNLEARSNGKNALVETAHGQLGDLIGLTEPIPKELFDKLLRKRRVLVVLDSLSELDETTHKNVRPAQSDFPIAALVVTSRIDEDLGGATKTTVRPLRLKSNSLSTFLHEYLTRCGKRALFEDDEFFDDCRRLSQIVGEREITVLIARLYADQMIAAKEQTSDSELPRNLPDLMQGYVKNLNDKVKADKLDTGTVLRAAKIVAAKCLAQTYRPSPARIDEVLKALNTETDAKTLLKYMEERIQIIQTTGAVGDRIRYSLDPLAEYLTGLYLVENYGAKEDLWQGFIGAAKDQPGAPEAIKGFLLAVRDCCVDKGDEYGVPERIKDELARLAGLDPEEVNAAHLKQRVSRLIANLKLPDADDRAAAAEMLGKIGPGAKSALPALIVTLEGDDNTDVRCKVVDALGSIGPEANQAISALIEALKDENAKLRSSAAEALRKVGLEAKQAIPALIYALNDEQPYVRTSAARALGGIGPEAKEAIPSLIGALRITEFEYVRSAAVEALGKIGPEAKEAIPALISELRYGSISFRVGVADALGKIGPEAILSLIEALGDESISVRTGAADALGKIGLKAIPSLIEAVKYKRGFVISGAAEILGSMGPDAKHAIPVLTERLNDENDLVRRAAARAIKKIKTV